MKSDRQLNQWIKLSKKNNKPKEKHPFEDLFLPPNRFCKCGEYLGQHDPDPEDPKDHLCSGCAEKQYNFVKRKN